MGSRLQTYYCARFFRKEDPIKKPKKGAVVLAGGGDGHMEKACGTARILLHHMNCYDIHAPVCSHNTDERPAIEDENALLGVASILAFFAEQGSCGLPEKRRESTEPAPRHFYTALKRQEEAI